MIEILVVLFAHDVHVLIGQIVIGPFLYTKYGECSFRDNAMYLVNMQTCC